MKTRHAILAAFTLSLCLLPGRCPAGENDLVIQKAMDDAIDQIQAEMAKGALPGVKNVAVIPLRGDVDGYVTGRMQSAVTRSPYALFARDNAVCNALVAEIEWGVRKEDVMDPATVQKFGKIQGVDAILYGKVWDRDTNLGNLRGRARISVKLAKVETGQVAWSADTEGAAYIHWSDALTRFWRYPLVMAGAFLALIVLWIIWRKIKKAMRPL